VSLVRNQPEFSRFAVEKFDTRTQLPRASKAF
jgi:hypothetical protein